MKGSIGEEAQASWTRPKQASSSHSKGQFSMQRKRKGEDEEERRRRKKKVWVAPAARATLFNFSFSNEKGSLSFFLSLQDGHESVSCCHSGEKSGTITAHSAYVRTHVVAGVVLWASLSCCIGESGYSRDI